MKRSKFNLSYTKLLSCDMGELIPVGCMEVLPGDTVQMSTSLLVRAAPLVAPVMHPIHVRVHHWYVPLRLIWDDAENFFTGGPDGLNSSVPPTRAFAPSQGDTVDYLGVPPGYTGAYSMLPTRAYVKIWNEWYRDQDLQTPLALITTSGNDVVTSSALQRVDWEKDYFTSARPWQQKGPSITIPIGTSAPVVTTNVVPHGRTTADATDRTLNITNAANGMVLSGALVGANSPFQFLNPTGLQADLSGASAVTVTALREALGLQRFEEARARYGSRYVEYLRYLGIRSSDARLQLPEYLGGGRQTIQFSEVLQTAPSGAATAENTVGALKGHGIGAVRSNRFRRFIEEHGFIMSLMSVRPKSMYMDGVPRMFNRVNKEDYWTRELEHIGQQEVQNKEVRYNHATPDGTFGWNDRYAEYRSNWSNVAGEFRTVLNYWHLARNFASDPALNASFVSCVPTERSFASTTTDALYVMANHSIAARRLVAKTGKSFIF